MLSKAIVALNESTQENREECHKVIREVLGGEVMVPGDEKELAWRILSEVLALNPYHKELISLIKQIGETESRQENE